MRDRAIILFPFDKIDKGEKVVIYGSGDIAQAYYWELQKTGYASVVAWIDSVWDDGRELSNPRMQTSNIKNIDYDHIVVGINDREACMHAKDELIALGTPPEKIIIADEVMHFTVKNYQTCDEKKLKIGFLATGAIAHTMALTIHDQCAGIELYAVASRNIEKAEAFKEQYGFVKAYGSYDELLEDSEIDIVYIATPVNMHYEQTMDALSHGKHVICEKPMAVNAGQIERMIKCAKDRNLFLTDGVWTAYLPMTKYLHGLMNNETVGKVHMISANLHYPALHSPRLTEYGMRGGQILENGYYLMEFLSSLVDKEPVEINATGQLLDTGVDLQTNITIKYSDGLMAVMNIGLGSVSDQAGFVYGERGMAIIRDANQFKQIIVMNEMGEIVSEHRREVGYWYEIDACVKAIGEGRLETTERSHELILQNARMIDEIRKQAGVIYPEDK